MHARVTIDRFHHPHELISTAIIGGNCEILMDSIHRSINEPIREGLSADKLWRGEDKGLVKCWELGRAWSETKPELAARIERGELPTLAFKGGVEGTPKYEEKYGTLRYYAMWQGFRGLDLDIDLDRETRLTCLRTGVTVTFTPDSTKYNQA